jgi:hypothetical protein
MISDLFLERVKGLFDAEAQERIEKSVEDYDRPYLDAIETGPTIITVSKWGSVSTRSYGWYVNDPWLAKGFHKGNGPGYEYFLVTDGTVTHVSPEEAGEALYEAAKAKGKQAIPSLNHVSGYIVSFEELVGSIPEHMRDAFEARMYDENTGSWAYPAKECLARVYQQEVEQLLKYMRVHETRMQVKDRDDETHEEWIDRPISAISVGFNRFDTGQTQATAFFSVSDMSPEFKPDVKFNWHVQDTSRWLYAGAIAINYTKNEETGEERIDISSHH